MKTAASFRFFINQDLRLIGILAAVEKFHCDWSTGETKVEIKFFACNFLFQKNEISSTNTERVS
jgi:hypothetical protein